LNHSDTFYLLRVYFENPSLPVGRGLRVRNHILFLFSLVKRTFYLLDATSEFIRSEAARETLSITEWLNGRMIRHSSSPLDTNQTWRLGFTEQYQCKQLNPSLDGNKQKKLPRIFFLKVLRYIKFGIINAN
jgi:hypothetical protein